MQYLLHTHQEQCERQQTPRSPEARYQDFEQLPSAVRPSPGRGQTQPRLTLLQVQGWESRWDPSR